MVERRAAVDEDYAFLRQLHAASLRKYVEEIWGWDDAVQERRFRAAFDPAEIEILLVDGRDIGAVSIERRGDALFLSNLQLLPDYQGRGIGTAVIGELLARARVLGVPVELQVLKNNPARRLYERLGFAVTAETETHFRMRAG